MCVTKEMEAQAAEAGDEVKLNINAIVKPLHKIIADNKDVAKMMMQLNAAIVMHRNDVNELLNIFNVYDELWKTVENYHVLNPSALTAPFRRQPLKSLLFEAITLKKSFPGYGH